VKVQSAGAVDVALQQPNELAINYQSDLGGKQMWYQNDTLTNFDPPHTMYATLVVPGSIDERLSQVAQEDHLIVPHPI
jgi:hypothetical protein